MDVAKRLAAWREQPPEQLLTAINRYLPPGVTAVLVIAIAYQLATITWTLTSGAPTIALPAARPIADDGNVIQRSSDLDTLANSHLFGEASAETTPVVTAVVDAPETTLSLTLTGILDEDADDGVAGQAMISSNRGQEKTYRVGQAIENADGATLHSVHVDRVLLNRNGRLETLRLPKELTASVGRAAAPMLPPAMDQQNGSLRQVITENASRLTDIVRLAPHVQEGQVVGFRVNPGRDRAAFEALGLQPGDVVTDINGTVLDDPSQGLQVFESLGESTQANVTVLREGVPQVIVIDTTQLQSLQENRE
jgi:general secretion pathway protein C